MTDDGVELRYEGEKVTRFDETSFLHYRGRLPHWEAGEIPQHITFRLADSLPFSLREEWREELDLLKEGKRDIERRRKIEAALDSGIGACWLRQPEIARVVEEALLHFDEERYHLHGWVVMPNHVHVVATPRPDRSLSSVIHSWKSFSATSINRLLHRKGKLWAEEYFDRAIRNEEHFRRTLAYVAGNPVKARLCRNEEDWPFSHAGKGEQWRWGRPVE